MLELGKCSDENTHTITIMASFTRNMAVSLLLSSSYLDQFPFSAFFRSSLRLVHFLRQSQVSTTSVGNKLPKKFQEYVPNYLHITAHKITLKKDRKKEKLGLFRRLHLFPSGFLLFFPIFTFSFAMMMVEVDVDGGYWIRS